MKKLTAIALFTCLLTAPTAFAGDDSDEVVYSTEGYCLLSNEGVSNDYLNAYARKLGTKPSMKVCNSFSRNRIGITSERMGLSRWSALSRQCDPFICQPN